jgi:hypothetical protein
MVNIQKRYQKKNIRLTGFQLFDLGYLGIAIIFVFQPSTLMYFVEGSLEVKLPTIWTVEKQR